MIAEKYRANLAALGEVTTQKLSTQCVAIQGNGPVSQAIIYNLIGLGVGSIEHITNSNELPDGILRTLANHISAQPTKFAQSLYYISPSLNYKKVDEPKNATLFFKESDKSLQYQGTIKQFTNHNDSLETIYFDTKPEFKDKFYSQVQALLSAALLADEVRKRAGHVSLYEQQHPNNYTLSLKLPQILHKDATYLTQKNLDRVLVIGAGGLGTYCTYLLSKRQVKEIVLCEPDTVEETNLNRQLFYTGKISRSKAKVLAERLSNKNTKIIPRKEFFDKNFNADGKLDAIFCCTDTLESRIDASIFAQNNNIPLVEGACTPTMGCITTYVPDKTKTICEQRDLESLLKLKLEKKKKEELERTATNANTSSCSRAANPSVIGPNVLIGALQAIALDTKYDISKNPILQYPQVFLNLILNSKFSQGGV